MHNKTIFNFRCLHCINFLFIVFLFFAGCVPKKAPAPLPPRPDRGYVNLLQKQSMLVQAKNLLSLVSQTERLWQNSGSGTRIDILLNAAPNWLEINSFAMMQNFATFAKTASNLGYVSKLGVQGLYLGPIAERAAGLLDKNAVLDNYGEDASALVFDSTLGDEKQYETLANAAENIGLELGADLIPASTGMGPDFVLQARQGAESSGLYAMLPVPESQWNLLPQAADEWDFAPLSNDNVIKLAETGLIAPKLARDSLGWVKPGGWAATGSVKGIDGANRRWIYRYNGSLRFPVLFWQDPFGNAKRIFSAAVIRQTGLLGQALVGLKMEALMGMEPESQKNGSLEPGLTALNEVSAQIHRYGGWALQADSVAEDAIFAILTGNCDFCRDDISDAEIMRAFNNKSASRLTVLYNRRINARLDFTRLAHGFNAWQKTGANTPENSESNFNANLLMQASCGLPGMIFISPFLNSPSEIDSRQNIAEDLSKLLIARKAQNIANGKLLSVTQSANKKSVFFISRLPAGNFWLLAINFGAEACELPLNFPAPVITLEDAKTGEIEKLNEPVKKYILNIAGKSIKNIILFK